MSQSRYWYHLGWQILPMFSWKAGAHRWRKTGKPSLVWQLSARNRVLHLVNKAKSKTANFGVGEIENTISPQVMGRFAHITTQNSWNVSLYTITHSLFPYANYVGQQRSKGQENIGKICQPRMPSNVPVYQALSCQVDLSLGRPPDRSWKRRPGRPPKRWLDQIRDDSQCPQPMCGETLSDVVIVERRDGPRWLCANDDDDEWYSVRNNTKSFGPPQDDARVQNKGEGTQVLQLKHSKCTCIDTKNA